MPNQVTSYVCCLLSCLLFGINYVPVKKIDTGDGLIFQWVFGNAIATFAVVVQFVLGNGHFYPFSMVGGALFATGNVCVVPIVKTIGISVGLILWAMVSLLLGWACGRFGLFGSTPTMPNNVAMNYAGVACCCFGTLFYGLIKPRLDNATSTNESHLNLTHDNSDEVEIRSDSAFTRIRNFSIYQQNYLVKKIFGISLAVLSGICYGTMFEPINHIKVNDPTAPQSIMSYLFGFAMGILFSSNIYFLIYCAMNKNKVELPTKSIFLLSYLSGFMWVGGMLSWMIANDSLGQMVTFPLIASGPSIVTCILGIVVFKEISGRRNLALMGVGFVFTLTGIILTALSR